MKFIALGIILGLTWWASLSVGEMPPDTKEPYTWLLPFLMFAITAVPSYIAYLGGREDAMDDFNDGRF